MVVGCWLEVVQVAEVGGVGVAEPERLIRVTIVDTVAFLILEESDEVILNDWVLGDSGSVGASSFETDCVTEGEHILKLLVLKGVFVDVHHAVSISEASLSNQRVWL